MKAIRFLNQVKGAKMMKEAKEAKEAKEVQQVAKEPVAEGAAGKFIFKSIQFRKS
jgi:hypothetical protein